jgi:nitroreductase
MIELLRQRRSVRKYGEKKVSDEDVAILEEAVLRAPSSRGINPWEFIFVDDPELLGELSRSKKHGSSLVRGAALAIVVCADETKADTWVEDGSIASILAQLVAQSLGLGSCWVQVRMREHENGTSAESYVQKLLGIPGHIRVESIVAIGHPDEEKSGHPRESLDFSKIRRNRYR